MMPHPVEVSLLEQEVAVGSAVGVWRTLNAKKRGYQHHFVKNDPDGFSRDVAGAIRELAVAKFLCLYWTGIASQEHEPDIVVPGVVDIEVRGSMNPNGALPFRPGDREQALFVYVTGPVYGKAPVVQVRGWLWGFDAQRPNWWCPDEPEYWAVPIPALRSAGELAVAIEDLRLAAAIAVGR